MSIAQPCTERKEKEKDGGSRVKARETTSSDLVFIA
jgi:hypothetical protein